MYIQQKYTQPNTEQAMLITQYNISENWSLFLAENY